jgi:hypothetical protein
MTVMGIEPHPFVESGPGQEPCTIQGCIVCPACFLPERHAVHSELERALAESREVDEATASAFHRAMASEGVEPDFDHTPFCNGAPRGFEADCGNPGPHGPHGALDEAPAAPPAVQFLRAMAEAIEDGAPTPYGISMLHSTMRSVQVGAQSLEGILWWAGRLEARTVTCVHRHSEHGDKFTVTGKLGGQPVEIWDVVKVVASGPWSEDIPIEYLTKAAADQL